jgi:hypothetical protein
MSLIKPSIKPQAKDVIDQTTGSSHYQSKHWQMTPFLKPQTKVAISRDKTHQSKSGRSRYL